MSASRLAIRRFSHAPPGTGLAALLKRFRRAGQRYRERRALADLDDHLLADIGVSRSEADDECRKPLWR